MNAAFVRHGRTTCSADEGALVQGAFARACALLRRAIAVNYRLDDSASGHQPLVMLEIAAPDGSVIVRCEGPAGECVGLSESQLVAFGPAFGRELDVVPSPADLAMVRRQVGELCARLMLAGRLALLYGVSLPSLAEPA